MSLPPTMIQEHLVNALRLTHVLGSKHQSPYSTVIAAVIERRRENGELESVNLNPTKYSLSGSTILVQVLILPSPPSCSSSAPTGDDDKKGYKAAIIDLSEQ